MPVTVSPRKLIQFHCGGMRRSLASCPIAIPSRIVPTARIAPSGTKSPMRAVRGPSARRGVSAKAAPPSTKPTGTVTN